MTLDPWSVGLRFSNVYPLKKPHKNSPKGAKNGGKNALRTTQGIS